jgi:tryptophanyl-tRNA synthetase
MSLDDPAKKMSKSAGSENSYIAVMDTPDAIRRKVRRAVTDSGAEVKGGPDKPALTNLLDIYAALSGESVQDTEARYEGRGYAEFKTDLAEIVVEALAPIQARIRELEADKSYTLEVLRTGAERAEAIAARTLAKARERIGLVSRP